MRSTIATMEIEVRVKCPYCDETINLCDDINLPESFEGLSELLQDMFGTDSVEDTSVKCMECNNVFSIARVDYEG